MDTPLETKLKQLLHAFLEENAQLNLSALRTEDACWNGNILDSIALLDIPEHVKFRSLLDIGTGGGFPLLPLAVALPEVQCTGMDSTQKKISAIHHIVQKIGVSNVHLRTGRAEQLGRDKQFREKFDCVTARAVAEISTLLEYAAPFVRVGGLIVLWKSMHVHDELEQSAEAQRKLRCAYESSHLYSLPADFGERQLLIFKKTGPLSSTYPRAVGIPKKDPL